MKDLHEYPIVLVVAFAVLLAVYTIGYLNPFVNGNWSSCLGLVGYQELPMLVLLALIWLMGKLFGRKAVAPWALGITLILLGCAAYMYAQALRPFEIGHDEFEPNLVFLFAPIDLFIVMLFLFAPLTLMFTVRRLFARKGTGVARSDAVRY